ncbi:hypothetical protein ACX80S_07555 [Arthrobacter sp. RHLT1-20]
MRRERGRKLAIAVRTIAVNAARQEDVTARNEPEMDIEVAGECSTSSACAP